MSEIHIARIEKLESGLKRLIDDLNSKADHLKNDADFVAEGNTEVEVMSEIRLRGESMNQRKRAEALQSILDEK